MLKKLMITTLMLVFALLICSSVSATDGMTQQVNLNINGGQPNGVSLNPVISSNGNYIAYSSDASNLVTNDTNGKSDIFIFNRSNNQTTRISVNSTGQQSNGNSYNPSINDNGTLVVFDSVANNLVPFDTNECSDIFLHNMNDGTTTRISGNQYYGNFYNPSISGDGRYVVYEYYKTTIEGSYGFCWIMLYNIQTGITYILNNSYTFDNETRDYYHLGNNTLELSANNPSISEDGRYVVYESNMYHLPPFQNNNRDIFRLNISTGDINVVSVDPYGYPANGPSSNPSINEDGSAITFQSTAHNLSPNDTNGCSDIFVNYPDSLTIRTYRVSVNSDGQQATGASTNPSISANGQYIIFNSFASNLVTGDTNGVSDIFMHDNATNKTTRISLDSAGNQFSIGSYLPAISADSHYAVYLLKPSIDTGYRQLMVTDLNWPSFTIDQIKAAASTLRATIENQTDPSFPVDWTVGGTTVTMQQFLELLTRATIQINNGNKEDIPLFNYTAPTNPTDNIHAGNIYKSEYLQIASAIKNYMDSSGKAPDYAYGTSLGTKMGYQNLVYMYTMIMDYYNTSGNIAGWAAMMPWSDVLLPKFTIDQIKAAATTVRTQIETTYGLPANVTINGRDVEMPQFLELLTTATIQIKNGNFNLIPLRNYTAPLNPTENIAAGNIYKSEYLQIASAVKNYMDSSGKAPDYAYGTSLGPKLRYENLVYMYSMILDYYNTSGNIAGWAAMRPWSVVTSPVLTYFTVDQIKAAASTVRSHIETNHQLPTSVNIAGIDVNMSQFLELTATATIQINSGSSSSIALKNYDTTVNPKDSIRSGNIYKSEYLKIANDVKNYMDNNGKTPSYAYGTSLGTYLGFQNLVYMYSMIMSYYTSGNIAGWAAMKPWSQV